MTKRRHILMTLCIGCMLVSLAACGTQGQTSVNSTATKSDTTSSQDTTSSTDISNSAIDPATSSPETVSISGNGESEITGILEGLEEEGDNFEDEEVPYTEQTGEQITGSWYAPYFLLGEDAATECAMTIDINEDGTVYLAYGLPDDFYGQFRGTWKEAGSDSGYGEHAIIMELSETSDDRTERTEIYAIQNFYRTEYGDFFSMYAGEDALIDEAPDTTYFYTEAFG